jgi:hypothetical protein
VPGASHQDNAYVDAKPEELLDGTGPPSRPPQEASSRPERKPSLVEQPPTRRSAGHAMQETGFTCYNHAARLRDLGFVVVPIEKAA